MATLTNFSEYYKTISNSELLQILENPHDYQPNAVEAAKHELAVRQLSEIEIKEAKEPLIAKRAKKEQQEQKVKIFEAKIKNTGNSLLDTINPVQTGTPTVDKSIRLIVLVFSVFFLYQMIRDYQLYYGYVQDFTRLPLVISLTFLPVIILPVALFTFWKRQKIGWMLLTIFLTFSIISILWAFYQSLSWRLSGLPGLDNLFPQPSPMTYIIQLLFFVGTLYVVCKRDMREMFRIKRSKMQTTIVITAIVSFFLILASS